MHGYMKLALLGLVLQKQSQARETRHVQRYARFISYDGCAGLIVN